MSALKRQSVAVLILLALAAPSLLALAWPAAEPAQEVQYSPEEYEAYQQAAGAEPGAREDALLGFIKAHPDSALNQYAMGEYTKLLQQYHTDSNWTALAEASEKLVTHDAESISGLYMATLAYFNMQQWDKVVDFGEKFYALKQDVPEFVHFLALAYQHLQNQDKYVLYGEKLLEQFGPTQYYFMLPDFMRHYVHNKNERRAAEYAQKITETFDKLERPAATAENEWRQYVNQERALAHAVLGKRAFDAGNWTQSINNYQRSLTLLPGNSALRAESYFHIGMSQWKQNRIDSAMESFAKGQAERGAPHADPCRRHLETLYKATHNDSLAGIDEFIERTTRR